MHRRPASLTVITPPLRKVLSMSRIFRRWLSVIPIATFVLVLGPISSSADQNDIGVVAEAIIAGAESSPVQTVVGVDPACTDFSYAVKPWHLGTNFLWYYNPANAPASVASTALGAITNSSQVVAAGQNRCVSDPNLPTKQQYGGTTGRVAQVSPYSVCNGDDGRSVVSWGTLPSSYLAYTCVYYRVSTGLVHSADVLIDNQAHQWFTTKPANCAGVFDVGSVMTHERGHTAGLEHVTQDTHAAQTMSPRTMPCDISKRFLAAGDLAGLRKIYHVS
jgi:hypothetical protein